MRRRTRRGRRQAEEEREAAPGGDRGARARARDDGAERPREGLAGRAADGPRAGRRPRLAQGERPRRADREVRRRGRRAERRLKAEEPAPARREEPAKEPEKKKDVPPPVRVRRQGQPGRGETTIAGAHPAPADDRAPDGRVQGHRARSSCSPLEVDMGEAVEFRKQLKAAAGEGQASRRRSTTSWSRRARWRCAEFPRANGAYRDGKFELYSRVNVGIAVAGQDALIVPTIFDADSQVAGRDRSAMPARWPSACAPGRSPRRSSPPARSASPTLACSASSASSR